jgi:hypothetical protein
MVDFKIERKAFKYCEIFYVAQDGGFLFFVIRVVRLP